MKKLLKSLIDFFYKKDDTVLKELSESDYRKRFIEGVSKEKIAKAYEKAWDAKNFEIENYWKRANYFWAFQVASFAGYFSFLSSDTYINSPQVLYAILCIGIVTSFAWALTNAGSKTWQRHWEIHVDMLEQEITGPLYKIATINKTYSVSKINEIVSIFFILIWVVLDIKYFMDNITFIKTENAKPDYLVIVSTVITFLFIFSMFKGHGRGRFGKRKVKFYERDYVVK